MSIIGIDIGGTKIAAGVVAPDGKVGKLIRIPTPAAGGPEGVLDAAARAAAAVWPAGGGIVACGVGTAGAVDRDGRISYATASLPGWAGTDVREQLSVRLGVPVTVVNDVHAMAAGEAYRGAAAGIPEVLVVAVGTGIGGALVTHGQLLPGLNGLAGSIGHLNAIRCEGRRCGCGGADHVESYAAGPAIAARYAARAGLDALPSLETVAQAAQAGDPFAHAAIAEAAEVLGAGLAAAVNLLDPTLVVLGGGVLNLGQELLERVRATMHGLALPGPASVSVHRATLGDAAVVVGAAHIARAPRQS